MCLRVCEHASLSARRARLLGQAPAPLSVLNHHFPYPEGASASCTAGWSSGSSGMPPRFLTSSGGRIALSEWPIHGRAGSQTPQQTEACAEAAPAAASGHASRPARAASAGHGWHGGLCPAGAGPSSPWLPAHLAAA